MAMLPKQTTKQIIRLRLFFRKLLGLNTIEESVKKMDQGVRRFTNDKKAWKDWKYRLEAVSFKSSGVVAEEATSPFSKLT